MTRLATFVGLVVLGALALVAALVAVLEHDNAELARDARDSAQLLSDVCSAHIDQLDADLADYSTALNMCDRMLTAAEERALQVHEMREQVDRSTARAEACADERDAMSRVASKCLGGCAP